MSRSRLAALAAPCDALLLDNIAALVEERYAQVVWIRLGTADADPGMLLLTLLGALARLDATASAGIGEAAARCARRGDWRQAYRLVGAALGAVTSQPAVVVLEGAEHLGPGSPGTLDLIGPVLRPALRDDFDVLLISCMEWDHRRLAPYGQVLGPRQLLLSPGAAELAALALSLHLPPAALGGIVAVTAGAAGALRAVLSARAVTGEEAFDAAAAAAANGASLLAALGRSMLARASQDTRIALGSASGIRLRAAPWGTARCSGTTPGGSIWPGAGSSWPLHGGDRYDPPGLARPSPRRR